MEVVWDPRKATINLRKHKIASADAATVLDDPRGLTIEDIRFAEQRFATIGSDMFGRVLVVVYSYALDAEEKRLISARRATPSERQQYGKKNYASERARH